MHETNAEITNNDTRAKRPAWGKTDRETGGIHHLAHHSMDVAAVFMRMTQLPVIRNRLEKTAERQLTAADCARLSALVFLHDIGKLHPGFQAKGWPSGLWNGPKAGHLQKGWEFLMLACKRTKHPFHKTMLRIVEWGEAVDFLAAILAHHGRPVEQPGDPTLREWDKPSLEHYDWRAETRVMDDALRRWFAEAFEPNAQPLPDRHAFHHLVCGLVALADWIGSDPQFFAFAEPFDPGYDAAAHRRAKLALQEIGFDIGALAGIPAPDFAKLTGFPTPNPAQAATGNVGTEARLLILEAETGSGKTEAALCRFTQLLAAGKVSSLYFAVPTRAAAGQLHGRVNEALRRAFGEQAPETVLAVPGMVRAGEFAGRRLPDWRVLWEDQTEQVPARWAAEHATRFLAASVAVGTVDQAMLAGLQAKHAHLRGSALSRSLLVIDEVHASDSYMTAILQGHLDAGGYAMLMSATLGSRARVLWTGKAQPAQPDIEAANAAPYPAVWVKGEDAPRAAAADARRSKTVHLGTAPTMAPAEAARRAVAAAQRGARVLVIRNTVCMAAATWRAVREAGGESLLLQAAGGPALHHGRFAVEDRRLLDREAEAALAPDKQRKPGGCIVIGTQTLEQSLDIDADLLLADLCPMDVLLQRIGRLHRHNLQRPAGFETARAAVLLPERGLDRLAAPKFENGLGGWKEDGEFHGIYRDLAGLELTRRLLAERPVWRIPQMNRELVEGSTHPDRIAKLIAEKGEQWKDYDRQFGGSEAAARMRAQLNVLDRATPFDDELRFPGSDEKIMTRLGEEGAVLKLDPPRQGPFGQQITRIALPARWSRGIAENHEVDVESDRDELILSVAERRFRYSREGLEKIS